MENIFKALFNNICNGRTLIKKGIIPVLLIILICLNGCSKIAHQNIPQSSEIPTKDIAEPSQSAAASSGEDTAASTISDAEFSKPGVYEITTNTAYSFKINNNGVNASICIKGIKNVDGDECITLVADGTENNAMDISEDKMKAYIIRKDNGNVGVLVSGEGNSDFKYNTYVYGFDGNKPVLKAGCGYESVSLTTRSITLQGTRDVFGTWVVSNDCTLNDNFSIEYSNERYFTVKNSINDTKYLDTKIDIPVQMLKGSVYTNTTLPAGSRIYPVSFGNENNQICLIFQTENGSTGRLLTDFGEHSYNISGIDEYDIFVDMPYKR